MRIAVTGGTGFVGAALLELLRREGHAVKALVRDPRRLPEGADVEAIAGDLSNAAALAVLTDNADIVLHLAGVTHPRDDADYARINIDGAAAVAEAAAAADARLVHVSSLSARKPNASPYAGSKAESEQAVGAAAPDVPRISVRLPAIYGPGDHATLPYFKLVKSGLALEPATPEPARASLLFVEDAARAILAAVAAATPAGPVVEVGDETPEGRAWSEIGRILARSLDKKPPRRLRMPKPVVTGFHAATRAAERLRGAAPSVRTDQANEFFHPDWVAHGPLLSEITDWRAETPLEEGFAKTVQWYQERGLL